MLHNSRVEQSSAPLRKAGPKAHTVLPWERLVGISQSSVPVQAASEMTFYVPRISFSSWGSECWGPRMQPPPETHYTWSMWPLLQVVEHCLLVITEITSTLLKKVILNKKHNQGVKNMFTRSKKIWIKITTQTCFKQCWPCLGVIEEAVLYSRWFLFSI